jgi:hypothetical protein
MIPCETEHPPTAVARSTQLHPSLADINTLEILEIARRQLETACPELDIREYDLYGIGYLETLEPDGGIVEQSNALLRSDWIAGWDRRITVTYIRRKPISVVGTFYTDEEDMLTTTYRLATVALSAQGELLPHVVGFQRTSGSKRDLPLVIYSEASSLRSIRVEPR